MSEDIQRVAAEHVEAEVRRAARHVMTELQELWGTSMVRLVALELMRMANEDDGR